MSDGFPPWFTLELTFGEARSLRAQIGDLPKSRVGPRLTALYRELDARLRLAGSVDDGPHLHVVREKVKRVPRPKPRVERTVYENTCPACHGEGIVADGERDFIHREPLEGIVAWARGVDATVAEYLFNTVVHTPPPKEAPKP